MSDKGKCFSMCNRGQRNKSDFYQTPLSMTEQLLEVEKFDIYAPITDPACGNNAIIDVLKKYYHNINYFDKYTFGKIDFLRLSNDVHNCDNIITNPPYRLATEFIIKAKKLYKNKIAMLLPLSYLHGQKRYNMKIFIELRKIYVFTRYPLLTKEIRADGKYNTGMQVYAWYIWQKGYILSPTIHWIDNNKYVLSKKENQ